MINYFKKIGLEKLDISFLTNSKADPDEDKKRNEIVRKLQEPSDEKYYNYLFKDNLDVIMDGLDYDINMEIIKFFEKESQDFDLVIEPCCQSGIIGNYLASKGINYVGIDLNKYAIEKAQNRAKILGLNPDMFVLGDARKYQSSQDPEKTLVIGRRAFNFTSYHLDYKLLTNMGKNANTVIAWHGSDSYPKKGDWERNELVKSIKEYGYNNVEIYEGVADNTRSCKYMFIFKAEK